MGCLLEPRVLQSLLGRDAMGRVVDEDFLQKIPEVFQERCVVGNDILQRCQRSVKNSRARIRLTSNFFMALTNRRDALVVSGIG